MINKKSLFLWIMVVFAELGWAEIYTFQNHTSNLCQYTSSLPNSHFGSWDKVYKLHFKKDIPLRLILKYPSNANSTTFNVYFQKGALVAGGEAFEEQFDPDQPYCAIKYYSSASLNEKWASQESRDYTALESLIKAGTTIEFEHGQFYSSETRNGKTIIRRADLLNNARIENYRYELNRLGEQENFFDLRPNYGDGVYGISCSSVYSSSNAQDLTVQMVLDSMPKDSLVIEERNINVPECE